MVGKKAIHMMSAGLCFLLLMTAITACGPSGQPYATHSPTLAPTLSPIGGSTAGPTEAPFEMPEIREIVVEGRVIDAPAVYADERGVVMIPLQAVAESLGYTVAYDQATQTMSVGSQISLTVGVYDYTFDGATTVTLSTAPALKEGLVYVPLVAFRDVFGMTNAYVLEGQVVIDNQEEMR